MGSQKCWVLIAGDCTLHTGPVDDGAYTDETRGLLCSLCVSMSRNALFVQFADLVILSAQSHLGMIGQIASDGACLLSFQRVRALFALIAVNVSRLTTHLVCPGFTSINRTSLP